jgi:hypothetical protein
VNNNTNLQEIKHLIEKALRRLDTVLAAQETKPHGGKPPAPDLAKRVEWGIWEIWESLKAKEKFTARDVKSLMRDSYCKKRSLSSYSVVLSAWSRDGYLECARPGSGPLPTIYTMPIQDQAKM